MLTEAQARRLAEEHLASWSYPEPLVVTGIQEFDVGWTFFYNTERHQRTGAFTDGLLGNSPILVDRRDGSVHTTGTAEPVQHYVDAYTREHP